jgi:hypothetical protein
MVSGRYARSEVGKKRHRDNLRTRRQTDPCFKLIGNLRSRVSAIVSGRLKTVSAVQDLGCTPEQLKAHLEKQFQGGMSWDNYGKYGWHVDHIFPLARVDQTDKEQMQNVVHYSNLQPLWAEDNIRKSDNIMNNVPPVSAGVGIFGGAL